MAALPRIGCTMAWAQDRGRPPSSSSPRVQATRPRQLMHGPMVFWSSLCFRDSSHLTRCKDFLNGLLTIDPALRTSIPYAYDHVWLQVLDIPPLAAAVDGVVYRSSADGCWDDTDEPLTMQPPDNAPRLTRQAAAIDVAVAP
mmetsp:Transcript_11639/g.16640  ORF Transcript_11639/g.16640 Transcript_11639/m.16640 type:complete len:142 (-) Transcript_11639:377-802(-)